MTSTPEPPTSEPSTTHSTTEPSTPTGPLSPRPGNLAVALLLVLLLFANLYADSQPGDYDGKYMTFAVIGLIAGVLGVDLSRFWRGGKDDQ